MPQKDAGQGAAYRLRTELDGQRRLLIIRRGENTIGALSDNDLSFDNAGVSRHHATLRFDDSGLSIADLGSKNGTFVNGKHVTEGVLQAGDTIAIGSVQMQVEAIDAEDGEIAIPLDAASPRAQPDADQQTPTDAGGRRKTDELVRWTELVNRLAANLIGPFDPNMDAVVQGLVDGLGAAGACTVEWDGRGEPSTLHVTGEPDGIPSLEPAQELFATMADAGRETGLMTSGLVDEATPLAIAVAAGPTVRTRGLIVWGEFPHRVASRPVLEVVLRLILHSQPEHVSLGLDVVPSAPAGLVFPAGFVVGASSSMRSVFQQMQALVRGDIPVLIVGETGVGKEHAARTLHLSSARGRGPFQIVHCAAIPADLLEAELFGIEKGVATGVLEREGKLQLAQGGVVFLDEIGDMPLLLQAKILRFLQSMEIHPVGAKGPVRVDVRIIAATNQNLQHLVESGKFRRDLYYRIAAYTLPIPPLRERRADIPALCEEFLRRSAQEVGNNIRGITVKALRALVAAPWLGNVRELEHEVRRLVYLCPESQPIDSTMLSPDVVTPSPTLGLEEFDQDGSLKMEPRVDALERKLITIALARAKGNRSKAARMLGLSRNGLAMKMDRLGIKD